MTNINAINKLSINALLDNKITNITKNKTFIGIDFGTSTTVVSVATYDDKKKDIDIESIRLDQLLEDGTRYQSEKIPSVIAWYKNHVLVGEGASNLKYILEKGKNIWYSFKMEIGEDLGAKYYQSEVSNIEPLKIRNPKDCVRVFFMYLKILILRYCENKGLSTNIYYAISIPASFEANQRKELIEAIETNGMNVSKQSLIDEPNAAFISFVHESQDSRNPLTISPVYNSKILVFDFGGGTCDISVLEIGKSANGLYSKNRSISKFTKLGGDDIDRYLVYQYLLPRFFEHNHISKEKFRTQEIKAIATRLYKVAEKIKIKECKELSILTSNFSIPNIKNSKNKNTLSTLINIETSKGLLTQEDFYLTNKEISDSMEIFTKRNRIPYQIKGQDEYNNIFMPIYSAIEKGNISIDELDYILLIGGSAQSPYIQEALNSYFENSEILVPRDLQTHVSKGSAIHSLLMHGMGKCIIQPITSEPIIVITKDEENKILIPAGTEIPCSTIKIDDLQPSKDNQETIELPICVGNKNKILYNIVMRHPNGFGFPIDSKIILTLELTPDKLLLMQAECMGIRLMVEPQTPFSNKELTTEERIVLVAERQANLEAESNNGIPTKESLIKLKEAYINAENNFKAGETLELQNELYPNPNDYNSIGVLYHNAGCKNKAIDFFERSLNYNKESFWPNFNLGHSLMNSNLNKAKEFLKKAYSINPSEPCLNILLGRIAKNEGRNQEAKEKFKMAYDAYSIRWKTDSLNKVDYGWFASAADELGLIDKAYEIRHAKRAFGQEKYYNSDNLTRTIIKTITK